MGTTCSVRALPKPAPPRDQVTASSPNLNPAYISEDPDTWGSHSMRLATTRETSAVMFCGLSSIKALAPLTQNLPGRVTNTCHVCHSGPLRELVGLTVSTRVLPVSYSATSVFLQSRRDRRNSVKFSATMYNYLCHTEVFSVGVGMKHSFKSYYPKPLDVKSHCDFINDTVRIISRGTTRIQYMRFPILHLTYLKSGKRI